MHHVVDRQQVRHRWNRAYPPVLTITSGDSVTMELRDSSDGQVHPDMTQEEFAAIDRMRIHALTGPVAVAGAEPGDALEIEILKYEHHGWAWTSVMPGLGALGDEIAANFVHFWKLEGGQTRSMPGVTLDLHPFCGVIGVQRAEEGEVRTRPPGIFGGNMDVRHLGAGARLWLPVLAPGGEHQLRAFLRQGPRRRLAQAARGAGDDYDLAGDVLGHSALLGLCRRSTPRERSGSTL